MGEALLPSGIDRESELGSIAFMVSSVMFFVSLDPSVSCIRCGGSEESPWDVHVLGFGHVTVKF